MERTLSALADQKWILPDGDFYKFTNLASFLEDLGAASEQERPSRFPTLFIENGRLKNPELKIEGLTIKANERRELLERKNPFSEIQGASFEIIVEKNKVISSPLRILYKGEGMADPVIFVTALENSKVTILEEAFENNAAVISHLQLELKAGSTVEHVQLSDLGPATMLHGATVARVVKDATYRNVIFQLGGKLSRRNLDLQLLEPGAHGESYNLYLTNGKEHSDINTVIDHFAADTTSQQLAKGILDNESRAVFTGKIHIHPQAQRVASGQLNKNLLLSKKAQVHSQPQLEIFADDVKCSHGSTTGQLSPEELFYFEARGIPEARARTLLAHGFGLEVVQKIQHPEVRERISAMILEKLAQKFKIGDLQ